MKSSNAGKLPIESMQISAYKHGWYFMEILYGDGETIFGGAHP